MQALLFLNNDNHDRIRQKTHINSPLCFRVHVNSKRLFNKVANASQPRNDRFDLCRGVEVVAGGHLRDVDIVRGHLFRTRVELRHLLRRAGK